MGCYDTVTFRCPACNARIATQSKAGPCDLLAFGSGAVPLAIAACISGDDVQCVCGKEWVVRLDNPETVRMYLEPPPSDDD